MPTVIAPPLSRRWSKVLLIPEFHSTPCPASLRVFLSAFCNHKLLTVQAQEIKALKQLSRSCGLLPSLGVKQTDGVTLAIVSHLVKSGVQGLQQGKRTANCAAY
jgi:hypothetical protein